MSSYTRFISDVSKSYSAKKNSFKSPDIFTYQDYLVSVNWCKRNFIPHAFAISKSNICSCDEIAFGTNKHLLILKVKISDDAKLIFLHDKIDEIFDLGHISLKHPV